MSKLTSLLVAVPAALAMTAPAALAQPQFTAKVYDLHSKKPVQSTIQYGTGDGKWHYLKKTDARGILSWSCPGPLLLAIPEVWEYSTSKPKDCAAQVSLEVERRDPSLVLSELMEFESGNAPIDRSEFAVAYVREISNGLAARAGQGEAALLARYAENPDQLSRSDRDALQALALNRTEQEFMRLDVDRDKQLTEAEIRIPAARRQ